MADPQDSASHGPAIGQVLGEYRIERAFGEGGFGAVYLASSTKLSGRTVVVKVIRVTDEASRSLLRHEAAQLVGLQHPSVVQVISFGEEPTFQYLVMEYLDGQTLASLISQQGALGAFEAVRVAGKIADALEAVHEAGLVHRDLKPANIMLKLSKDRGRFVDWLKLIDFGLAFAKGRTDAVRAGTPAYVAPETVSSDGGAVTHATDLYALGCIVYELLTGVVPFEGKTDSETLGLHIAPSIPRVSEHLVNVPPELDELVFQLLQRDPTKRPTSALTVSKALGKIERTLTEAPTAVRRLSSVLRPIRASATGQAEAIVDVEAAADEKKTQPTMRIERGPTTAELYDRVKGRSGWPVAVALLLLMVFGGWWWSTRRVGPESVVVPTVTVDAGVASALPVIDAGVVAAVAADAGARVAQQDDLAPLPERAGPDAHVAVVVPIKKVVVVRNDPCEWTGYFQEKARGRLADYRGLIGKRAGFARVEDELSTALADKDCHRVNQLFAQLEAMADSKN